MVVEPVVNGKKLRQLLALETEYPSLDFKMDCDLSEKRAQVELAKDVGAMSVRGGFLVIGVDGHGKPTGHVTAEQAALFDEARLRLKLLKWLPDTLEICTQVHDVEGHRVVLVHISPNPAGCAIFRADGSYDQPGDKPPKVVFREGDAFHRDGTRSARLSQHGLQQVISEAVKREEPEPRVRDVHNEVSGNVAGPVIQVGDVHLHVSEVRAGRLPPRAGGLMDFYVRWFAGRSVELARISAFLADPTPGYLLVEAQSGFGKSALAAQVIHRIRSGFWGEPVPDLVYFFVREQQREHTAAAFLSAVNSQLMEITGKWRPLPADPEALRVQFETLWQALLARARPLLLVVDGLDEAAAGPELSISAVLPDQLGPSAHVLVTSRPNPVAPDTVSLEHPLRTAQRMTLGPLTAADVGDLVSAAGHELDGMADRIFRLTKGEPFFVRYVCESVTASGAAVLDDPAANGTPDMFFRHEFARLSNAVSDDLTWRALAVLTIGHDPLTVAELADALDEPPAAVDRALRPVLRYLAGEGGFELPHVRLRAAIEHYLGAAALAAADAVVRAWGTRYATQGWPDHTPAYLANHYLTHLENYHDHPARVALVSADWLRLTARRTGSYRVFAEQIRTIGLSALKRDPLDVVGVVRCGLVLASLRSASGRLPASALAAMAFLGRVPEAVDHAILQDDAVNRAAAFCAIARSAPSGSVVMHDALDRAEDATADIDDLDDGERRIRATADLVAALVAAGRRSRAFELATHLADADGANCRVEPVPSRDDAILGALAAAGAFEQAADIAACIANMHPVQFLHLSDEVALAIPLSTAYKARAFARARNPDQARSLAQSARREAHRLEVKKEITIGKRSAVIHLVDRILATVTQAYALIGEFAESVSTAEEIATPWRRGEALIAVAETAVAAGNFTLAAELADQSLSELEPRRNDGHGLIFEDELIPLLARATAILAETGHDAVATDLLADLERRMISRRSSWDIDNFIAQAAIALANDTNAETEVVALLDHLTNPKLRHHTSALCAAGIANAGRHAESAALAHRVLAEWYSDPPSKLDQWLKWSGPLLRAFTVCGDQQAAGQLTNWLFAALETEPKLTPGMLLEFAGQTTQTDHGGTAKKALKVAFRAARNGSQVNNYVFWVNAALIEDALGRPRRARRYADRGVAVFHEAKYVLPPQPEEAIGCAQRLIDVGLADHGRKLLLAAHNQLGTRAIAPLRELGRRTDLFTNVFGKNWVHDQLAAEAARIEGIPWAYRDQLSLAQAWFHLGEHTRATQQIEQLIRRQPRAGYMPSWAEAVCESAYLLLQMNIQDTAHQAFVAAVNWHLVERQVRDSRDPEPLEQFLVMLRASLQYLLEVPGGTTLVDDVIRTVVDAENWLHRAE